MKASDTVSNAYWQTRPRDSQLASAVSRQSRPLPSGETFDAEVAAFDAALTAAAADTEKTAAAKNKKEEPRDDDGAHDEADATTASATTVPPVPVPRPANWGGILIVPNRIEFWIEQKFRMADRTVFERSGDGDDDGGRGWKAPYKLYS